MTAEVPKIFWAKIPGFAPWPARHCSKLEAIDLRKRAFSKGGQVATVFLERRMKRGWVSEANIEEFKLEHIIDPSAGRLFSLKSFDTNGNYRLAIMEAVRITYSQVNTDPNISREEAANAAAIYQQITSLIHKHEPGFPLNMRETRNASPTPIEICELCHGTIYSGELRSCSVTEDVLEDREARHCAGDGRVHFHCLQPHEEQINPDERWYCAVCCDNYEWQPNVILPADERLFPFFGTVERYLPASIAQPDDQLYHISYDDGDGEDFTQRELQAGMDLHDKFKGPQFNRSFRTDMFVAAYGVHQDSSSTHPANTNSTGTTSKNKKKKGGNYAIKGRAWTRQHSSVGARVCKYFVGEMAAPTLHAKNVRNNGRNGHAVAAEEEAEGMEVEIKTELGTFEEEPESNQPEGFVLEQSAEILSPPVSSEAAVVSTADATAAIVSAAVMNSNSDATSVQDKTGTSEVVPVVVTSTQRAGKRTAILLDQPPQQSQDSEEQKTKQRLLNMEKQAAAKRQLQSTSTGSSSNGVAAATEESAASSFTIKKKKTCVVEEADHADNPYRSHYKDDNRQSSSSSNVRSRDARSSSSGARGDSNDPFSRRDSRDGRDSGNSGSNSRSYSRYDAPSHAHATTLYDTRRPSSSTYATSHPTSTTSTASSNVSTARNAEVLSLAPAETSNHTGNIKVVHFIDQCLSIMKRHQQQMIVARQRVLQAYTPMETEFSNNLVEALAADIVQIISPAAQAEVLSTAPVRGDIAPSVKTEAVVPNEAVSTMRS